MMDFSIYFKMEELAKKNSRLEDEKNKLLQELNEANEKIKVLDKYRMATERTMLLNPRHRQYLLQEGIYFDIKTKEELEQEKEKMIKELKEALRKELTEND